MPSDGPMSPVAARAAGTTTAVLSARAARRRAGERNTGTLLGGAGGPVDPTPVSLRCKAERPARGSAVVLDRVAVDVDRLDLQRLGVGRHLAVGERLRRRAVHADAVGRRRLEGRPRDQGAAPL